MDAEGRHRVGRLGGRQLRKWGVPDQINRSKIRARRPLIGITAGDPAGIGPEIIARFLADFRPSRSKALVIGSPDVMRPWADRFGWNCPIIDTPEEMSCVEESVSFDGYILDTGCRGHAPPGKNSRAGGEHAGRAIDLACELAGRGLIQAIVTAPISKEALNMADYPYPGHTEMLADRFDSPDCQMMMVYRKFRVVPLSRHIPVSSIPDFITGDRIFACLRVVDRALKMLFNVEHPCIAVAALNPHSGEGGVLGKEEIEVIEPALRKAKGEGIRAEGPFAADSLFQFTPNGRYDAFVTMYHDQGLVPYKMVAKKRGVNVTVGLPIVRTSVDHGVAFDIAQEGKASATSMEAAYRLAERLVRARKNSETISGKGTPWKNETL